MKRSMVKKPEYGNWVSMRLITLPSTVGLVLMGVAILFPPLLVIAALFLLLAFYFMYARYLFSPRGGNVQAQVRGLILSHLEWDGEGQLLDIGCGSAALTISLAKKFTRARMVGMDYWGEQWEYSKKICETNANLEGVAERVSFHKGSAAALPFEDNRFDAIVSNLVFHEVSSVQDKKLLLREALRVLKKGGLFVFQDLFQWKQIYGEPAELIETILSWGIAKAEFINTSNSAFIPTALKLPFMIGTIGIIAGKK
jgi:ubiquinone/menaquinone biosynthesis C-methylase UbiE